MQVTVLNVAGWRSSIGFRVYLKPTFLKAAILPSFERVPSGKNSTEAPAIAAV